MVHNYDEIIIQTEKDAYDILERIVEGERFEYSSLKFDGWPTLSLYFKGKKFDQSITPTVMRGLLELQKGVYRSYAAARFNTPSHRLSEEEKDDLELKISVKGGSSNFEINFQDIALKLIEQLGNRMNPTEILYTVLAIAAMYFGNSAYKSYLQNRVDIRAKETSDDLTKQALEALRYTSEQETKRVQIIAELAQKDQRIETMAKLAYDAHTEVVKTISAAQEAKLGDVIVDPGMTEYLVQNARRTSSHARLDGLYRIVKLDWSSAGLFKVKVVNSETNLQLDALVQDDSLTGKYKDAIKTAEWSRKPVKLQINAKVIGGDTFRDVTIVSAELVD